MSSHDISHLNSSNGWPTPAASRFGKQRRLEAETPENPWPRSEAHAYALLLATFSICSVLWSKPLAPIPKPSLRPIWHRVVVKPGQVNHSFYKDPSSIRRNSNLPRDSRDFTVPMLISSVVAISS